MPGFYTPEEIFKMVQNSGKIENTILSEIDLKGSDFIGINFEGVTFDKIDLSNCNFSNSVFINCVFNDVNIENCKFIKSNLDTAIIINSNCNNVDFSEANLLGTMFFIEKVPENNPDKVDVKLEDMQLTNYDLKMFNGNGNCRIH